MKVVFSLFEFAVYRFVEKAFTEFLSLSFQPVSGLKQGPFHLFPWQGQGLPEYLQFPLLSNTPVGLKNQDPGRSEPVLPRLLSKPISCPALGLTKNVFANCRFRFVSASSWPAF